MKTSSFIFLFLSFCSASWGQASYLLRAAVVWRAEEKPVEVLAHRGWTSSILGVHLFSILPRAQSYQKRDTDTWSDFLPWMGKGASQVQVQIDIPIEWQHLHLRGDANSADFFQERQAAKHAHLFYTGLALGLRYRYKQVSARFLWRQDHLVGGLLQGDTRRTVAVQDLRGLRALQHTWLFELRYQQLGLVYRFSPNALVEADDARVLWGLGLSWTWAK